MVASNFSLIFDIDFTRTSPPAALTANLYHTKTLNYSMLPDCLTGLQIQQFKNHPEPNCAENPLDSSNIIIR
jgi:hypothetical protein